MTRTPVNLRIGIIFYVCFRRHDYIPANLHKTIMNCKLINRTVYF